jgi:hypothetical protein
MDLTRYWRAQHHGNHIEVQWTGFRFQGGWTLRLLVNGELKAERKVRRFVRNFEVQDGPVTVNFWGKPFRIGARYPQAELCLPIALNRGTYWLLP